MAELVEEITVDDEPGNVVHANFVLIHAASPEGAYEKALEKGRQGEIDYTNTDGRPVRIMFRGLRNLHVIHDRLEDGAEILYEEARDLDEKTLREMIRSKEQLNMFRSRDA